MASNDPGIPAVPLTQDPLDEKAAAEKPPIPVVNSAGLGSGARKEAGFSTPSSDEQDNVVEGDEDDRPILPDQFDPRYETSRWEIWSYYSYYVGNNGLSLFNFAPTQFQNLLSEAAGDSGMIHFAGGTRTVESTVLLCNGISFAIQCVVLLVIGSYADFGRSRPYILIVLSIIAFGIGFGWLGVYKSEQWRTAAGLYIVGLIAYQTTLTFWTAAFPGLARNTRELRTKAEEYSRGSIDREEYDYVDTLQRSRLSNIAFFVQSVAEVIILALIVGVLFGVHVNASQAKSDYGISVLIAFATGVWLLVSLPWFVIEKRRPGNPLPPGMNVVQAGFWQLWRAISQIWQLRQSFIYLIGYFLLGDSLNTTVTVVATLQNAAVAYNPLTLTYLFLVGIPAQAIGIYSFWWIQKRFRLGTKTMFNAVIVGIVMLDAWGMIGVWTQRFGYHHAWEFWLYQAAYGLFVCPWYSYSQIMISEVTPRGKEFLFFALFSIIGKTSSFIGPFISTAIIGASGGNNNTPFYFLLGLTLLSGGLLVFFLDLKKSRVEQAEFLERERLVREKRRMSRVE